ncbi:hypothetical protein GUJ93_ZPchr0016g2640 [Zizania palustris]|uniref:Uncharacterized protein n=1 Tax=Zizania palustris TaxID=103762 RepID=A0A8J5W162_ZIZPA|nr:hypothetical protein GUJ93_ZPchr0016g2640 [Zizania palustris]
MKLAPDLSMPHRALACAAHRTSLCAAHKTSLCSRSAASVLLIAQDLAAPDVHHARPRCALLHAALGSSHQI